MWNAVKKLFLQQNLALKFKVSFISFLLLVVRQFISLIRLCVIMGSHIMPVCVNGSVIGCLSLNVMPLRAGIDDDILPHTPSNPKVEVVIEVDNDG